MRRGKTVLAILTTVSLIFLGGIKAIAQTGAPAPVLIVEVQTGSSASASQEFIELANNTSDDIDISDWRVEYFSAGASNLETPSRVIPLHGVLPAAKHYLIASSGYLVGSANDSFSAGLAATGGHLRIVAEDESSSALVVYDLLGWGTALHPEDTAAGAASAGQSMQRRLEEQNKFIDTNNNSDDFEVSSPNPEGFIPEVEQPEEEAQTPTEQPQEPEEPIAENTDDTEEFEPTLGSRSYKLDITELLPNPASPQTDAVDEFIELYNPNDVIVEMTGYKLQTGTTYSHAFEFNDQIIEPKQYKVFYIRDTGVVLANSAGKARLIDPDGLVVSETSDYVDAPEGEAWAWDGSGWQWSTTPTPNARNQISVKPAEQPKTEQKANSAGKKAAATKTKKATAKKASAKLVKAAKKNGSGAGATQVAAPPKSNGQSQIHPAILAGVGSAAVLYGAYEYRHDLANAIHRVRGNRKNR